MTAFKVGDKVKVVRGYPGTAEIGDVFTVTQVRNDGFRKEEFGGGYVVGDPKGIGRSGVWFDWVEKVDETLSEEFNNALLLAADYLGADPALVQDVVSLANEMVAWKEKRNV